MKSSDVALNYNVVDILEHNLAERADKVALYSYEREMTFQQVSDEANRVGNALKEMGIGMGDTVGILSFDCPEWVTTFFGSVKIGAIAACINTLLTAAEYDYILRDSHAKVLVVHEMLMPMIEQISDNQPFLEQVVVIGRSQRQSDLTYRQFIEGQPATLETVPTHRDDFCTLNYSSGTTGEPKGILHAHKDFPISAELYGRGVAGMREEDRSFGVSKLFFTYGMGGNLIYPWHVGASIVLMSRTPRLAANVLDAIDRFKPTVMYSVPTSYALVLAEGEFTSKYDLSSLRLCVSAGEALPAAVWHAWKKATGVDIIDGIGNTENFAIFVSNVPDDICPGSSGKPVKGFDVKVVNEDGDTVPAGELGNLMVKSDASALFYLHQYEKSRKTFRGEWLFTGDKYYMDEDGYYWHAGRADDMLKVGGIWVSPVEVESVLVGHPAVMECAVVGKTDHDDLIKPIAYVILNEGFTGSDELAQELITLCKDCMANYKRPRWVEFVDYFPRTATGKLQRVKLRKGKW